MQITITTTFLITMTAGERPYFQFPKNQNGPTNDYLEQPEGALSNLPRTQEHKNAMQKQK